MSDATPPPVPPTPSPGSTSPPTPAIAFCSVILGILSFTCGSIFTAIPAVICGHIARGRIRRSGDSLGGRKIANAGLILGYAAIALSLTALPLLVGMFKAEYARLHQLRIDRHDVVSNDGTVALSVPGTWIDLPELNKVAVVRAGSKSEDAYAMIIRDAKADFPGMTLEQHHQRTRDAMLQKMPESSGTSTVHLTIGGRPALQDELSGTGANVKTVFLHTTIDDVDHYEQILTWTTQARWPAQNALLREVSASFHRVK